MTEPSRRQNARLELERAEQSLRAAQHLAGQYPEDCLSRSYYAALQAARALLFSEGLEAKTHRGVAHLLNLHFVRPGLVRPEAQRWFAQLMTGREQADYDNACVFTAQDAQEALSMAHGLVEACRGLLAKRWP